MIKIPKSFEKKYRQLLGDEYETFVEHFFIFAKDCVRVNTLKTNVKNIEKKMIERGWKVEKVPWYENAFFVETDDSIAKTEEHFLGYYYMQDAASLIPPIVLAPLPGEFVLDLCAAPGSKSTLIGEMMKNKGLLVANEKDPKRLGALTSNLQRIGIKNSIVIQRDGRFLWKLGMKFDKILLDVPCSASGTIITNKSVLKFWSEKIVRRLSNLQKQLIESAVKMLKENGVIVYSTCSLDPEENEENIDWAIRKFNLKVEEVEIKGLKYRNGITEWNGKNFDGDVKNCIRIYPQDNLTEGFFICKLRK